MPGDPRAQDPPGGPEPDDAAPPEREERCGPVRVERHRKDDGRSLILYTREAG